MMKKKPTQPIQFWLDLSFVAHIKGKPHSATMDGGTILTH